MRSGGSRLALIALLFAAPLGAKAELYRWIDGEGIKHYTHDPDRIPRGVEAALIVREAPEPPPAPSARVTPKPEPALREPMLETAPAAEPARKIEPLPHPAAPTSETPAAPAPPARAKSQPMPPVQAGPEPADLPPSAPAQLSVPVPEPLQEATPEAPAQEAPLEPLPADTELAELEAQVERDRAELRSLIAERQWSGPELAQDERLRELADRLPRLQAQLERLRRNSDR